MSSKHTILEQVDSYTPEQLVDYIRQGVVTFEELCNDTDGYFSAKARREVQALLAGNEEQVWQEAKNAHTIEGYEGYLGGYPSGQHREEAQELIRQLIYERDNQAEAQLWREVNKKDKASLEAFLQAHPNHPNVADARQILNELIKARYHTLDIDTIAKQFRTMPLYELHDTITTYLNQDKLTVEQLHDIIAKDHNILHADIVRQLITDNILTYEGLERAGVAMEFISAVSSNQSTITTFPDPPALNRIHKVSTEVYFWGIPSSGKTCALGGILSVANGGHVVRSMHKNNDCQGYGYMTLLSALFRGEEGIIRLPEGTAPTNTYEMGFDLEGNDNRIYPLTFVDLSGEMIRCMYKHDAQVYMQEHEEEALKTLTNILVDNRTKSRKVHFFVLEYGGHEREYEGLRQQDYLDSALQYIDRTRIFAKDTDAIYLIVTKVDKAGVAPEQLGGVLTDYINERYRGFYNGLVRICNKYDINGGEVEILPFSMGEVCFQAYCRFDPSAAENVISTILSRAKGNRTGKIAKLFSMFRK